MCKSSYQQFTEQAGRTKYYHAGLNRQQTNSTGGVSERNTYFYFFCQRVNVKTSVQYQIVTNKAPVITALRTTANNERTYHIGIHATDPT